MPLEFRCDILHIWIKITIIKKMETKIRAKITKCNPLKARGMAIFIKIGHLAF